MLNVLDVAFGHPRGTSGALRRSDHGPLKQEAQRVDALAA